MKFVRLSKCYTSCFRILGLNVNLDTSSYHFDVYSSLTTVLTNHCSNVGLDIRNHFGASCHGDNVMCIGSLHPACAIVTLFFRSETKHDSGHCWMTTQSPKHCDVLASIVCVGLLLHR